MRSQQISMFDGQRLTLDDAIDLTRQSLIAYGLEYRHWAIAYSGGKDSSALLKVVMNPLARIQKDTTMTPQEALEFLDGARFENYSGQIIAEHANKNKDFILCELGCACSEVASKNADEYGEVLITLLNSVKGFLAKEEMFTHMIAEVCDHNEILHNALRLIAKNEASTLDVRGIARDALNAVKPIDADE